MKEMETYYTMMVLVEWMSTVSSWDSFATTIASYVASQPSNL